MKHKRLLTKEEMAFIDAVDLFKTRKLTADVFRRLNEIRNECLGTRLKAIIGCNSCAITMKQHLHEIYLLTEEHFKTQQNGTTERKKRKPRRTTKRNTEQSNSGSEGGFQESRDEKSATDAEVVRRGSTGGSRKSNRPSTEDE
jgi:hypothetical protein